MSDHRVEFSKCQTIDSMCQTTGLNILPDKFALRGIYAKCGFYQPLMVQEGPNGICSRHHYKARDIRVTDSRHRVPWVVCDL